MKAPYVASVTALAAALAFGCQSQRASRIQEHAALFQSLDPATQQIVREGLFAPGFSREVTYISLGKPNHVAAADTEHGRQEVWKYRNFVYGIGGAMQLSAAMPGTTRSHGPILSPNAPGGPSLFSTKSGPMQPSVSDGSDAPVGTLYIEFLNGRIVGARIDP